MAGANHISLGTPVRVELTMGLYPFGLFYNRVVVKAKVGDTVKFRAGSRKYEVLHKREVLTNSREFARLRRLIYGAGVTTAQVMAQWDADALLGGYGKRAYDRERVMYMEFKEIAKEEK